MNCFSCIIAIVCIYVCFLSIHFKLCYGSLDCQIGDGPKDQIYPRILSKFKVSCYKYSLPQLAGCGLYDARCGMQLRDLYFPQIYLRNFHSIAYGMQDVGLGDAKCGIRFHDLCLSQNSLCNFLSISRKMRNAGL